MAIACRSGFGRTFTYFQPRSSCYRDSSSGCELFQAGAASSRASYWVCVPDNYYHHNLSYSHIFTVWLLSKENGTNSRPNEREPRSEGGLKLLLLAGRSSLFLIMLSSSYLPLFTLLSSSSHPSYKVIAYSTRTSV